jgi:penicillin-insensitive murein endopeptidase
MPKKVFVYGETGKLKGGPFKPHKTHQNGLSVDFMVPVLDKKGKSVRLSTNIFNKWGYGIEFDSNGKYKDYTIDFETISAHLYYLDRCARAQGVGIRLVIFDPQFTQRLHKTQYWPYLSQKVVFSKKRSWVRHDEHYHVDFDLPCQPL